ncbi:MAG: ATP phosphoribosyltransferase [Deltaproteobacteria bacterium]|nr:ATP phosphoribosyltransferase [Deltaproteobacteria bacterium]
MHMLARMKTMTTRETGRNSESESIHLAIPKGRMQVAVVKLLEDAGIEVRNMSRGYRPAISLPGYSVKLLKPQNIVEMLHLGSRGAGFAAADWVAELGADVVELLDTRLDPVRIVAAAPPELLARGLEQGLCVIASEYEQLTRSWMTARGYKATFVRSYGATEVFPPEDADAIVDNTATGDTLRANNLEIFDELMTSSTRLYASRRATLDPRKKEALDRLVLLLRSVLEARRRVMVEVNVSEECLDAVLGVLPCMREPTISSLRGNTGYAVKAAVPRELLATVIPEIRARGGTDIVVSTLAQLVA